MTDPPCDPLEMPDESLDLSCQAPRCSFAAVVKWALHACSLAPSLFVYVSSLTPFLPVPVCQVLQPAHIYEGTRRVRRSKLYYLWEKRDPKEYTITG